MKRLEPTRGDTFSFHYVWKGTKSLNCFTGRHGPVVYFEGLSCIVSCVMNTHNGTTFKLLLLLCFCLPYYSKAGSILGNSKWTANCSLSGHQCCKRMQCMTVWRRVDMHLQKFWLSFFFCLPSRCNRYAFHIPDIPSLSATLHSCMSLRHTAVYLFRLQVHPWHLATSSLFRRGNDIN